MRTYQFYIAEKPEGLDITYETIRHGSIYDIQIHIAGKKRRIPAPVIFHVTVPSCGVYDIWTPKIHLVKALNLDWFQYLNKTNGFTGAPVQCLIDIKNQNCAALGVSDTLHTLALNTLPVEESGDYVFTVQLFQGEQIPEGTYDVTLHLDLRSVPYYEALQNMAEWWEKDPRNQPAQVPEPAKELMYSTWYAFHQMLDEDALLTQCRMSKELGCSTILLDDGWQTEDKNRGYAYCGDWKPAGSKIGDMAAFVQKVHDLGMLVMPWYSVPFIGENSENFTRFQDMLIDPKADRKWHVLDPRYPEVRDFIISLFEAALNEWDVDGFKMDFVDEFVVTPFSGNPVDPRRDFESFHDAADCLMKACMKRLKNKKPNIMLEFRQTYNGPMMRSYGNIFRAVDCPMDAVENRIRITDIRLLSGNTAVHSDMIMWHPDAKAEDAALQVINILFSVPQISMRLEELSDDCIHMLRFYCSLWKEYKNAFINGSFEPSNPGGRYSVIKGSYEGQFACAWHGPEVISMDSLFDDMIFINGTGVDKLYLEYHGDDNSYQMLVYSCKGDVLERKTVKMAQGFHIFDVPASGVAQFQKYGNADGKGIL